MISIRLLKALDILNKLNVDISSLTIDTIRVGGLVGSVKVSSWMNWCPIPIEENGDGVCENKCPLYNKHLDYHYRCIVSIFYGKHIEDNKLTPEIVGESFQVLLEFYDELN